MADPVEQLAVAATEIAARGGPPWPDPQELPIGLPPVLPLDLDLVPDAFRPLVEDTAERMQGPPDFVAAPLMVAAGSVIGRQIGIHPAVRDDWQVVPNLWGLNVGRPGLLKTPMTDTALKPVMRLEVEAKKAFEEATAEHATRAKIAKAAEDVAKATLKKRLREGASVDELASEMAEAAVEAEAPVRRRFVTNDSTIEQLQVLLRDNPIGILMVRDELPGWLQNLSKEGRESSRAFYLEGWNGSGRFTYDTVGRGTIDIEACCISVFGNIQPGPLAAHIQSATRGGAGDDGLLQRFQVATWPDTPSAWRPVDRWPDGAAKQLAFDVFHRLAHLGGAPQGGIIPARRFDPEAQVIFTDYRAGLEQELRSGELHPALEGHLSKYRSLVPSLALICALADDEPDAVSAASVLRVVAWAAHLRAHAERIWSSAVSPEIAAALALAKRIKDGWLPDEFGFRDVQRKCWSGLSDRRDIEAALSMLCDLDWLRSELRATATKAATVYLANPKLKAPNYGR
jgi:putative DNA primase/helicase